MANELPLAIREVSPGPEFERVETGTRWDGRPESVHTGGLWRDPSDNTVWKPLDGRPHMAADCHLPTEEWECLTDMGEAPGFPYNWRRVCQNGRKWLVRPWSTPLENPTLEQALQVEQAIRALNRAHWEMADEITVLVDPVGQWFFPDLSAAHKMNGNPDHIQWCNEIDRVLRWWEHWGYHDLAGIRRHAVHLHSHLWTKVWKDDSICVFDYPHVYAWLIGNRPCPKLNRDAIYARGEETHRPVHQWVLTLTALCQADLDTREGLIWGWSPIDG